MPTVSSWFLHGSLNAVDSRHRTQQRNKKLSSLTNLKASFKSKSNLWNHKPSHCKPSWTIKRKDPKFLITSWHLIRSMKEILIMKLRLRTANSRQWLWNTIRKLEDSKHKSSSLKEKDRFNQFKTNPSKCKTTLEKTLLTKSRKRNSPFTKHAEWVQRSKPHSQTETTSCHVKST